MTGKVASHLTDLTPGFLKPFITVIRPAKGTLRNGTNERIAAFLYLFMHLRPPRILKYPSSDSQLLVIAPLLTFGLGLGLAAWVKES